MTLTADNGTATTTLMAGVETITVVAATTATIAITMGANDLQIAAGKTLVFNASALTNTAAALTFTGNASELDGSLSITGGNGADNGADTLTGGGFTDTTSGGIGADVITGGLAADALTGGAGADTFVYTSTSVAASNGTTFDSITDWTSATDKLEVTLDYSALTSALTVSATRASAGVAGVSAAQDVLSGARGQYVYDTTNSVVLINVNADNLFTTADFRIGLNAASTASATVVDGDINFVITGGTNADVITAGGGADTITSGGGIDSIDAGAGTDTITSTAGGTIVGGLGADAITMNGAGDYLIRFTSSASFDTITNTAGWATGGNDKFQVSMAGISIGNGDTTADAAETDADGVNITAAAELAVIQANTAMTAANAVANIGAAGFTFAAAVAAGVRKIIVADTGADSAVFLFVSAANDTSILATELTLIGFANGIGATAFADFAFVA